MCALCVCKHVGAEICVQSHGEIWVQVCEHVKLLLSFHIFICAHMGMLENMCNVHAGLAENSSKLTMAYIFRLNSRVQ